MRPRTWFTSLALLVFGAALMSAQSPPYSIITTSLPDATLNQSYSATLEASVGYEQPNAWSVVGGNLPPGLQLAHPIVNGVPDPYTTNIEGAPTAPGLFTFTLEADQAGSPPLSAQAQLTIYVAGGTFAITTETVPDGAVGTTYSQTFTVTGTSSGDTLTWSAGGESSLPPGLSLSPDGVLSGIPTSVGTYYFAVQVTDVGPSGGVQTAGAEYTINITPPLPLGIGTDANLPPGSVGVHYSQQFTQTGGPSGGSTSWSIIGGSLPPGLTFPPTGLLSGTPTTAGTYSFIVQVLYGTTAGTTLTTYKSFTLLINGPPGPLTITTDSPLPAGAAGVAYSQQLAASGGTPAYTWQLASGTLPAGLSLNATTGVIAGTPTANGASTFQVSVTDTTGATVSKAFTLTIAPPLSITTASPLPAGAVGTPYSLTLAGAGGVTPYTWSTTPQSGGLPPGLALDAASGTLSGTPTASGSYTIYVVLTDASTRTTAKTFTLSVETALSITSPSPLPGGTAGTAYSFQFTATGGTPSYTWSITAGTLPLGLGFDAATGSVSGTPTAGGTFNITVGVRDAVQAVTKAFQLIVGAPTPPTVTITGLPDTGTPATQPSLGVGLSSAYSLDITGRATMTFAPDGGVDDPAVQFTAGGRTADFRVPAGATQAVFGSSALGVQTGTVAGTITITLQLFAAGVDVTSTPPPTKVIRIAGAVPVIVSAKLVASATGFDLIVTGYSTTREVTGATVHLTAASGTTLAATDFNVALSSAFSTWYQSAASAQYGSQFTLDIPFTVQNASSAIASATVTLTNSQGTSTVANATF